MLPTLVPLGINADSAQLVHASTTSAFYINRDCDEGRLVFIESYLREAGVDTVYVRFQRLWS
jgi:hypothetical protein